MKTFNPARAVSNEDKLKAYALFKQATVGDVNVEKCVVRVCVLPSVCYAGQRGRDMMCRRCSYINVLCANLGGASQLHDRHFIHAVITVTPSRWSSSHDAGRAAGSTSRPTRSTMRGQR